MQKNIFTVLSVCALAVALTACGSPKADSAQVSTGATATAESSLPAQADVQNSFTEIVLVDNEDCTFKITAVENDSIWGYTLKSYLENKTDQELMFTLSNVSVNGFMCDPFWASSVMPGMKANEEIHFSTTDFARNGIESVTLIEGTLKVYDSNNWEAEDVVLMPFALYPLGEAAVQPYVRASVDGEMVLFDDENCTMIVTGFDPENTWGYTVDIYLENKTDNELMFSVTDASVNGFMCDPFWAETVASGKRSNTAIRWTASTLEENGITQVETIALSVRVYDNNDWLAEDLVSETFNIQP